MTKLRGLGVVAGTIAMIAAVTAFRVAMLDDDISILALIAFVCGLGIAYGSVIGVPGWLPDRQVAGGPDLWDRTGDWIAQRGAVGAMIILTLLVAVVHANVFRGEPYGDDLTFHMAESARIADCLRGGDFDFWNPSANGGYASLYYYQAVPQLASAIPSAVFGHHLFWFQLSVFLPIVIAPAAAYRGMRLMGASPWQALCAAACCSLMNGESRWGSGNAGTFQVGLYTQTWALGVFPLALGHGVRWVRDGQGLAPAIAWGTMVGLCHPFAGIGLGLALFAGAARFATVGHLIRLTGRRGRFLVDSIVRPIARLFQPIEEPVRRWLPVGIGIVLIAFGWIVELVECTDLDFGPLNELRGTDNINLYIMPLVPVLAGVVLLIKHRRPLPPPPRDTTDHGATAVRLWVLGLGLVIATLPGWITLLVDYSGFGGFPHRVNDEIGPGLVGLLIGRKEPGFSGYFQSAILDYNFGAHVLTWGMPLVAIFARDRILRWLWAPAIVFAALLALGPHLGTTQDDLFPMVRFLGALQICLALATGAGAYAIGRWLCTQPEDSVLVERLRWAIVAVIFVLKRAKRGVFTYGIKTAVAAATAALGVLLVAGGAGALGGRVLVYEPDNASRVQMMDIFEQLDKLPPGRKMVGPGAENHWWNLLSYVYFKRPSLLQMGGGGLQASPNYDFLWSEHDWKKEAWLYDAPYIVVSKEKSDKGPSGEVVIETDDYQVKKLPAPGIVSPVSVTGNLPEGRKPAHKAALNWLKTQNPVEDHVLDFDPEGQKTGTPLGQTLRARLQDSPGDAPDIVATVDVTAPTTFMARESWHPRWHAYIDGDEVPVRRVTPDFPAIDVPAGRHELAFRFERPWWATASWLVWPGAVLLAWFATRRRAVAPHDA